MFIVFDRPCFAAFSARNAFVEHSFGLPERIKIGADSRSFSHEKCKIQHAQQTTDLITAAPPAAHGGKRQMIFER
jgi:hypothetical protein